MAATTSPRRLVIVESPTKARTIVGYLGDGYDVTASVGHIRDLPQPSELPADMKKGPYGRFAVDVDSGFTPYYRVDPDKKKKVTELKKLLKDADELYLATDEDREGEAIAWHLLEVLKPTIPRSDLPQPSELPADMKKGPYGRFAVDVDSGFTPYYRVDPDKKKKVTELKKLLKDADELYLATDEDREGEAIAWHLLEVLKPTIPVKRMFFHEITPEAIERALENTRDIDTSLVDAQETRRILDRLYGYEVSPVLWRKIRAGLSAGRVQSVATRLVVEREARKSAV